MNGCLSRWMVMLVEFNLKYVPEKSIKGKVVAELLAEQPTHTTQEIYKRENIFLDV